MTRLRLAVSLAIGLAVASVLSVRLAGPELGIDEITYAGCVTESMLQGTVLPVRGNGALFSNKPPLGLLAMKGACEILGPSPFAVRLPSVLAAAATAVLLYLLGAALAGDGAGILAALVFAFTPSLLVLHGTRSATLDSLDLLVVALAIASLEAWRRLRRPWALAVLVLASAVSAWVKSPFALAVLFSYLLATELPARRAGVGTPRFGVTLALVLSAWVAAYLLWLGVLSAALSPRTVARQLLLGQYVRRVEGKVLPSHLQGPAFYPLSLLHDFGPLLLLPVLAWIASRVRTEPGPKPRAYDGICLAAWSLAAPVLATASASKMPWYAYLSYPGIALLVGWSARTLAGAMPERRAARAALWIACVAWLAWRVPAPEVWPDAAHRRGPAGRLWDLASRDPSVVLVEGPGFRFSRQLGDDGREARLLLRMLLLRQARSPAPAGSCRAILVNHARLPAREDVVELSQPAQAYPGILLLDRCAGRLRRELLR